MMIARFTQLGSKQHGQFKLLNFENEEMRVKSESVDFWVYMFPLPRVSEVYGVRVQPLFHV